MKKLNLLVRAIIVIIMLTVSAGFCLAADQEITLSSDNPDYAPGSELRITVGYDVSDNDNTLNALGVRIHFDSTKFDYNNFEDLFETNKLANPQLQDDLNNEDNDENTNKLIVLSYTDPFNINWPNQPLPLDLVTFVFTVKDDAPEGPTNLNVTRITGHVDYGFVGNGSIVNITYVHSIHEGDVAPLETGIKK